MADEGFAGKFGRFVPRYFFALGCSLYLFTIGAFKNRMLIYQICEYFGWKQPVWVVRPPEELPQVSVESVTSGEAPVMILPTRKSGNVSLLETVVLNKVVKQAKPERLFEIGTFDGRTTLHFAANSPESAHVYTLDLPPDSGSSTKWEVCANEKPYIGVKEPDRRFRGTPYESKITQVYGDSATFAFTPYHGNIDLIFVDGSHAYEYAVSDSKAAMQMIRKGGTIFWHDYGEWDGVTKALNELRVNDPRFKDLKRVEGTTLAFLTIPRSA